MLIQWNDGLYAMTPGWLEAPLWIDEEATLYSDKYNNTSAIVLEYFSQCNTTRRLKYLPPSCNNSSDLSHPQWPIVTTAKTLGSTINQDG